MDDSDSQSAFSLSSLLCQENDQIGLDEEDVSFTLSAFNAADDEYVQTLFAREISCFDLEKGQSSDIVISDWIKCARLEAITWILNKRALFGFQFQTAYLSVTYIDRFLSRRVIDGEKYWAIRLLSVACLSLAAKMEESRVSTLSEFSGEDFEFESKVIQRMELLVLNTLEWRMGFVTPFVYIHFFITKFCMEDSPPRNIVSRTVEIILATMRDISLMDVRPSVIAGAATLAAMDKKLTRQDLDSKINALFPSGFLDIEEVFSCYTRMQELEMDKSKLPNCILSPDLSPIEMKTNVLQNSSVTSAVGTKRKRLTFNKDDQNNGKPEEKRYS